MIRVCMSTTYLLVRVCIIVCNELSHCLSSGIFNVLSIFLQPLFLLIPLPTMSLRERVWLQT